MFFQWHNLLPAITGATDESWDCSVTERIVVTFQLREVWWGGECGTIPSSTATQDQVLAAWLIEESSEHSALEPWGDEGTFGLLHLRVFLAGRNSWIFMIRILVIKV
jgi:hypothetical protein